MGPLRSANPVTPNRDGNAARSGSVPADGAALSIQSNSVAPSAVLLNSGPRSPRQLGWRAAQHDGLSGAGPCQSSPKMIPATFSAAVLSLPVDRCV